jgi:hypothetical protein
MIDEVPIAGRDDERHLFRHLAGRFDVPAYVRRGRHVQEDFDSLVQRCRHRRDELLETVRWRLRSVLQLATAARDAWLCELARLLETPVPQAKRPTASDRKGRRAIAELCDCVARFNQRWERHLRELDLAHVNAQRQAYNRYYLVEKECALRSARLARQGYSPLPPVTAETLLALLPLLPRP